MVCIAAMLMYKTIENLLTNGGLVPEEKSHAVLYTNVAALTSHVSHHLFPCSLPILDLLVQDQ